ncbi:MAG: hypothetical protein ACLRVN_03065 [Butyricicoccus sp.]
MINLLGQVADTHVQFVTEGTQPSGSTAQPAAPSSQQAQERQLTVVQLHAELLDPVSRLA